MRSATTTVQPCDKILACVLAVMAVTGCTKAERELIQVTDLQVFAPIPGTTTGVAYLNVNYSGALPVTLVSVSSPQFERVEIHETMLSDGIASMRFLHSIEISANVEFTEGGKHIMLMQPVGAAAVGDAIELRLRFADDRLIVLSAVLKSRVASRDWASYPILRFDEVPEVEVILMPTNDQPSLGVGEAAQGPAAAAIANAVSHASGLRVRQLPLSPERIRASAVT